MENTNGEHMSIRRGFSGPLVIGLIAFNLLVGGLSGYSLLQSRHQSENLAQAQTRNVSISLDQQITQNIAKIDLALQTLVDEFNRQSHSGRPIDPVSINAAIQHQLARLPEVVTFRATQADGVLVYGPTLSVDHPGPSVADRDYFQVPRTNADDKLYITRPLRSRVDQMDIIILSRPYTNAQGRFAGEVHAVVSVQLFSDLLRQWNLGPRGTLILRDPDLGLIARYPAIPDRPVGQIGNNDVSPELRQRLKSSESSFTYQTPASSDGIGRIFTFRHLSGAPMNVLAGVATDDFLEDWYQQLFTTVAIVVAFVLASLVIGWMEWRQQKMLRDTADAEHKANETKTAFLANMSHEIRTPMNGIIGLIQIVREMRAPPEIMDKLDKIDLAGQHMLRVVNSILDISKIGSGKLLLNVEDFSLRDLLHRITDQMQPLADNSGLALNLVVMPDVPDVVRGDKLRLTQCLINYLANAIKFTPTGKVDLNVSLTDMGLDGPLLRFEVTDTGIGISASALAQLFESYVQVEAATIRHRGGTGLGLMLTKRLAELMGGKVGASSTPGMGSCFWFTACLPLGNAEMIVKDTVPQIKSTWPGRHVLVVEDVALNREILRYMLTDMGITIHMAENGKIAVNMAREKVFDLILMDMRMPVMDGVSATKVLRQMPSYADVPIIALTANAFSEDRDQCLAAGMNEFLSKPVLKQQLIKTFNVWLGTHDPVVNTTPAKSTDSTEARGMASLIAAIPGLSPREDALESLGYKQFRDILGNFAVSNGTMGRSILQALNQSDISAAREQAHILRSTAGMIGFQHLHVLASRLEDCLVRKADPDTLLSHAGELADALDMACQAIRQQGLVA